MAFPSHWAGKSCQAKRPLAHSISFGPRRQWAGRDAFGRGSALRSAATSAEAARGGVRARLAVARRTDDVLLACRGEATAKRLGLDGEPGHSLSIRRVNRPQ